MHLRFKVLHISGLAGEVEGLGHFSLLSEGKLTKASGFEGGWGE